MDELGHDLRIRTDENQARSRAIMAFMSLGERLKALTGGGEQQQKFNAADALGASALFDTIEGEIIPRLMLAHRSSAAEIEGEKAPPVTLTKQDQDAFLLSILQGNASSALQFADELLQRGISREELFLDLLATSARRLGEMWEQDLCDFTDVTIGLCRLHEIVRKTTSEGGRGAPHQPVGNGPRILLATACGDQHVFGIVIVADFLRRAGWRVVSEPGAKQDKLAKILGEREFDILGLSVACSVFADLVAEEIKMLRAASRNQNLKVLTGGRLFADDPDLAKKVGADAFAIDAKNIAEIGEELLAAKAVDC